MTAWPMADQWLGRARECVAGSDTAMHPLDARIYHGSPDPGDVLKLPIVDSLRIGTTLIVLNDSESNPWAIEQPDGSSVATVTAGSVAELRLIGATAIAESFSVPFGTWRVETFAVGVPT